MDTYIRNARGTCGWHKVTMAISSLVLGAPPKDLRLRSQFAAGHAGAVPLVSEEGQSSRFGRTANRSNGACIASPTSEAAASFRAEFGGVMYDPKRDREKGRARPVRPRLGSSERILELGRPTISSLVKAASFRTA